MSKEQEHWVLHSFLGGAYYISVEHPNGDIVKNEIAHIFADYKTAKMLSSSALLLKALKPFADAMMEANEQCWNGNTNMLDPACHTRLEDYQRAARVYNAATGKTALKINTLEGPRHTDTGEEAEPDEVPTIVWDDASII